MVKSLISLGDVYITARLEGILNPEAKKAKNDEETEAAEEETEVVEEETKTEAVETEAVKEETKA